MKISEKKKPKQKKKKMYSYDGLILCSESWGTTEKKKRNESLHCVEDDLTEKEQFKHYLALFSSSCSLHHRDVLGGFLRLYNIKGFYYSLSPASTASLHLCVLFFSSRWMFSVVYYPLLVMSQSQTVWLDLNGCAWISQVRVRKCE